MILEDSPTYYEILQVPPDASPQDIRAAYLRAKAAYGKGSLALYTLISTDEIEFLLNQIEDAYQVLSDPDLRKQYDENHGIIEPRHVDRGIKARVGAGSKEPMFADAVEDLVAPSTDFNAVKKVPTKEASDLFGLGEAPLPLFKSAVAPVETPVKKAPQPPAAPSRPRADSLVENMKTDHELRAIIEAEEEWHGSLLRRIRETQNLSLEEMSDFTKVTKTYLQAIENEDFDKLPAAVYLRGFLIQIAKRLKLPYEQVATAYVRRYREKVPERS